MKNTRIFRTFTKVALSASFLLALASVSKADLTYFVSLDVSSLLTKPNAPFALDFQLITGSGNVSNTVTLSNFVVTGGNLSLTPDFTNGGQSGRVDSSIVLTNTASDNEYATLIDAGVTLITFKVTETLNSEVVGSGTPIQDQFNVAIYNSNVDNLPTLDPSGGNALVSSVISAGQTLSSVQTFASPDSGVNTFVGTSAVPEPGSAGLLLLGACGLLARRKRPIHPSVA
jgi:hypothetical protein